VDGHLLPPGFHCSARFRLTAEPKKECHDGQSERQLQYGDLLGVNVLDTRQYRSARAPEACALEERIDGYCSRLERSCGGRCAVRSVLASSRAFPSQTIVRQAFRTTHVVIERWF
jgi:hypothetical protein